jgi:hypothetical protein
MTIKNRLAAVTMASVGIAVSFVVLLVVASLVEGWVLSILWGWFITPLGFPIISIWHGVGISLMMHFSAPYRSPIEPDLYNALGYVICRPFITLAVCWLVHFFV